MSKEQKIKKYLTKNPPQKEGDYQKLAIKFNTSADYIRKLCKMVKAPNVRINRQSTRNSIPLSERLIPLIKTKQTLEGLCNALRATPQDIRNTLKDLSEQHYVIDVKGDSLQLGTDIKQTEQPYSIDFKKHREVEYPIGFTADNHIGSKYERLDVLNALYDRFESYGVETVYNGGNMIDGECRFNKFDIYVHGVEAQVKNLIEKYPQRKGMVTKFVTGDDHEGWYVQREHINIGQKIEDESKRTGREDLIHLGYMERDNEYKQSGGSSIIRVIHAGGGSSYATSYTSQKYVESLQGGEKPTIVLVGHFHKFDYSYPRNVHVIQMGTTEDQTPFMRKKRIEAHVGGGVIWVKQNEKGIFTSVKIEWLPFYNKKFYQYKW